jgi:hypothetical protein
VAGCCECGDEPSGSCATELVRCTRVKSSVEPTEDISVRTGLKLASVQPKFAHL